MILILLLNIKLIEAKFHESSECISPNITWNKIYDDYILTSNYNYIAELNCTKYYLDLPNSSIIFVETWHIICNSSLNNTLNNLTLNNWITNNCNKYKLIKIKKYHNFKNNKNIEYIIYEILLFFIIISICYSFCNKKYNKQQLYRLL